MYTYIVILLVVGYCWLVHTLPFIHFYVLSVTFNATRYSSSDKYMIGSYIAIADNLCSFPNN